MLISGNVCSGLFNCYCVMNVKSHENDEYAHSLKCKQSRITHLFQHTLQYILFIIY